MVKHTLCLTLITVSLTGCMNAGPKQTAGHVLGAATGAVIGSQFGSGTGQIIGAALGTFAGSMIGGMMGQKLDERDKALAEKTVVEALEHAPDRQIRGWRNPNTQHAGHVQVIRTREIPQDNLVCRDYVHTVVIDGRQEQVHGRACRDLRDSRGAWMVQN